MIDEIIVFLIGLGMVGIIAFAGYEYRGKVECEKHKDYRYSYDYGACVKIDSI